VGGFVVYFHNERTEEQLALAERNAWERGDRPDSNWCGLEQAQLMTIVTPRSPDEDIKHLKAFLANLVIVICIRFPKSTFVWDSHPEGTVVAQPSLSTHSTSLLRVSKAPRSASYGSFSPMVHLIGSPSKQQSGFSPLFLPKSVLCSFKRLEVSNTTIHSTWSDLLNIPRILIHINSASWDTVLSVYAMLHLLLDQQPKVKQKRRKLRFQILQPQFSKVSPPPKVKTWS